MIIPGPISFTEEHEHGRDPGAGRANQVQSWCCHAACLPLVVPSAGPDFTWGDVGS